MPDAIAAQGIGKWFSRYDAQKPITIMDAVLSGWRRMQPVDRFWALRYLTFAVAPGEMLGVIGHNGAGKSTLLQLLGGVAAPTEGELHIRGRIGALLDLGAGLHGDLTGRENIFVLAIAAGLTHRQVSQRFEAVVDFAELSHFIDQPVRTYSTGMMMRLAFSVAVHTDPQILLVDEFLSVGDLSFQSKCLDRITTMRQNGCAIVLVSHDAGQVKQLCDRVLWLHRGEMAGYGSPEAVVEQYVTMMQTQTLEQTPAVDAYKTDILTPSKNRFGSFEIEITAVRLQPQSLITGDALTVELDYANPAVIAIAIFSISISQPDGQKYLDVNTLDAGIPISLSKSGTLQLTIERLDLAAGQYFVDVGVYEQEWSHAYDYHWQVYSLTIASSTHVNSWLHPPFHWKIKTDRLGN
jgi:lipopolysaccharide transport system ATP-binding protein